MTPKTLIIQIFFLTFLDQALISKMTTYTNNQDIRPIQMAAENGHWHIVQAIFDANDTTDPEFLKTMNKFEGKTGYNGDTLLHLAASSYQEKICELIMSVLDDKNPPNNAGKTPFDNAAKMKHWSLCQLIMVKQSNDPIDENRFPTPLHIAAMRDDFRSCITLTEAGYKDFQSNDIGETPLHIAAKNRNVEICQLLSIESSYTTQSIDYLNIVLNLAKDCNDIGLSTFFSKIAKKPEIAHTAWNACSGVPYTENLFKMAYLNDALELKKYIDHIEYINQIEDLVLKMSMSTILGYNPLMVAADFDSKEALEVMLK